jgi:hypothetical protein
MQKRESRGGKPKGYATSEDGAPFERPVSDPGFLDPNDAFVGNQFDHREHGG